MLLPQHTVCAVCKYLVSQHATLVDTLNMTLVPRCHLHNPRWNFEQSQIALYFHSAADNIGCQMYI